MASECNTLSEILAFYGVEPYWSSPDTCLTVANEIVETDPEKTFITKLKLREGNYQKPFSPKIFELQHLNHLSLASSSITGDLPDQFDKLPNLETLSLRNNQITGRIPNSISKLSNLVNLFLNDNQFSGEINDNLANLNKLEYLHLSNNKLSGKIPEYIGYYENLKNLTLSYNDFSGTIPESFKNLELTDIKLNDLPNIEGKVPKINSSYCSFRNTNVCYETSERPTCKLTIKKCSDLESNSGSSNTLTIVALSVVAILIAFVIYCCIKKRNGRKNKEINFRSFSNQNNSSKTAVNEFGSNNSSYIPISMTSKHTNNSYSYTMTSQDDKKIKTDASSNPTITVSPTIPEASASKSQFSTNSMIPTSNDYMNTNLNSGMTSPQYLNTNMNMNMNTDMNMNTNMNMNMNTNMNMNMNMNMNVNPYNYTSNMYTLDNNQMMNALNYNNQLINHAYMTNYYLNGSFNNNSSYTSNNSNYISGASAGDVSQVSASKQILPNMTGVSAGDISYNSNNQSLKENSIDSINQQSQMLLNNSNVDSYNNNDVTSSSIHNTRNYEPVKIQNSFNMNYSNQYSNEDPPPYDENFEKPNLLPEKYH